MMTESEQYITALEEQISLGKEMQRLESDEGFKKLFIDGMFGMLSKDIAQGYATLANERKEKANKDLYAISFFYQFCEMIKDSGANAQADLNEHLTSKDSSDDSY